MKAARLAVIAAAAVSISAAAAADLMGWSEGAEVIEVPVTETRIDCISGIVYRQVKRQRGIDSLKMTALIPRNRESKPAIVYFPGGGFIGSDHEKYIEMRFALARAGFVVAAAEYRPFPTVFPGLVEDGKAAVRYLRAHAEEYGIDPERIGVFGDSAGGYLASMLGTTNGEKGWDTGDFLDAGSDVQAVASIYGLSDLLTIGNGLDQEENHNSMAAPQALLVNGSAYGKYPGASIYSDRGKALNASPVGHVDGSEPPFMLMHGTADVRVSPMQSKELYELLKTKNVDARYVIIRDATHGNDPWFQKPVIDRVVNFFREKLGGPK